jgi:hypothetical protein
MNGRTGTIALAALAATAPMAAAQAADFTARLAVARAALVKDLEGYAAWCGGKDLLLERQKALELVLTLDPDHVEAHKTLGHVRAKDGSWSPSEKPRTFRDHDRQALAEAPARFGAATQGYTDALVALLEAGGLAPAERELVAHEALRFHPDDERVHVLLGEVKGDKGWVLPETVRAKDRREVLRGLVKTALEGAPPAQPTAVLPREKAIPLALQAVAAPGIRAVGTANTEELQLGCLAVLALEKLLRDVFASPHGLPDDTTLFLLALPTHKAAFVEHHPGITPAQRPYFEKLECGGVQGTNDFAAWTGDTQQRIDAVVRLALGYWLAGAYHVQVDQGWIYEGLGLYLTRSLVRTRLTWLAQASSVLAPEQDMALRHKLKDPETNWMDEALRLLVERRAPRLVELFPKGAGQLTTEDVLYAYALTTYLLEARPEAVGPMLEQLGKGTARAQAFQQAVGMDLDAFERHFERWLRERV